LKNKADTISAIAGVIAVILAIFWVIVNQERLAESQKNLEEAIQKLDRIVNRAIVYCENSDSYECDELMNQWFEECKKPEYNKIPSCQDGRIQNYLTKK